MGVIKGVKAFNKDMTCKGLQYKEGKSYFHKKDIQCCESGFHFCENPLDCLSYYDITESEFYEVQTLPGAKIDRNEDDSKVCTNKIKIGAKLGLKGFIKASIDFLAVKTTSGDWAKSAQSGDGAKSAQSGDWAKSAQSGYGAISAQSGHGAKSAQSGHGATSAQSGYRATSAQSGDRATSAQSGYWAKSAQSGDWAKSAQSGYWAKSAQSGDWAKSAQSGDWAKSAQSGDWAKSAQSGDRAKSAQSGDWVTSELNGKNGIAASIGIEGKAKGKIGNWIVLAEWKRENGQYTPVCVKAAQIDGKKIKEDTWYVLKDKEFTEA